MLLLLFFLLTLIIINNICIYYYYPPQSTGMWGGGAQSVDNGTAAWGQVSDAATVWEDPDNCGKASGWGTPSPNSNKPGKN